MKPRFRHYLFSGLLHLLLLALILTGAQCSTHVEAPGSIQGVLVTSDQVLAASKHAKPPPPQPVPPAPDDKEGQAQRVAAERQLEENKIKAQAEAAEQQKQADAAKAEQQKQADAAKAAEQKKADEKRMADQKQAELVQKQAQEKEALQRAAEAEQKKRDDQKKADEAKKADDAKKAAEAKKAADAAAADKKREEDLMKQQMDTETKRLADLEKKRKDEAARRASSDRMAQDDLKAQLGAEEKNMAQNSWIAAVSAAIRRRHNPPGPPSGCTKVRVALSRTGDVTSASVARPSGNLQYDDSVVRAAYAASPLPLPTDMAAFDSVINVSLPLELCHP